MPATETPAPARQRRDRAVRRAELVALWAVECVRAYDPRTDWPALLLADPAHRHQAATLERDGYRLDELLVQRVSHCRGTAYVRLICRVSVRRAGLPAALARRPLRGVLDELLLAPARQHRTNGRLIDAAAVPLA